MNPGQQAAQRAQQASQRASTWLTVLTLAVLFAAGCGSASSTLQNISGSYTGSFTTYGHAGSTPMQLQITQSGRTLSGTTTEASQVATDSGTISADGSLAITEVWSFGTSYLRGSVTGPGHLSGTWNNGGSALGTWDVHGG